MKIKTSEEVIWLIKNRAKEDGVSMYQLSKMTGITQGHLSRWINGHTQLTLPYLIKICEVLDIELHIS